MENKKQEYPLDYLAPHWSLPIIIKDGNQTKEIQFCRCCGQSRTIKETDNKYIPGEYQEEVKDLLERIEQAEQSTNQ